MEGSIARVLRAYIAREASSIETMPEMPKIIPGKTVYVLAPEADEGAGRFSEDLGIREEAKKETPASDVPHAPRVLLDGQTDQGYRPAPTSMPARRDVLNETDSREWRRGYQEAYRENN